MLNEFGYDTITPNAPFLFRDMAACCERIATEMEISSSQSDAISCKTQ